MQLEKITKVRIKDIKRSMKDALKVVEEQFGIDIKPGNATYEDTYVNFKVTCTIRSKNGEIVGKEAEDFKAYANRYGLNSEDLGKRFMHIGNPITIIGAKPKSTKYPILGKKENGKIYKYSLSVVKKGLIK